MPTFGVGQDIDTREYYVVVDGQRTASFRFLRDALAYTDARRERFGEGTIANETLDAFLKEQAQGGRA